MTGLTASPEILRVQLRYVRSVIEGFLKKLVQQIAICISMRQTGMNTCWQIINRGKNYCYKQLKRLFLVFRSSYCDSIISGIMSFLLRPHIDFTQLCSWQVMGEDSAIYGYQNSCFGAFIKLHETSGNRDF